MRERPPAWRPVHTLPLPGDEADTFEAEYAKAVRRDDRLTALEFQAKCCVIQQRMYGLNFCLQDECSFCGGLDGWQRWDAAQRLGVPF